MSVVCLNSVPELIEKSGEIRKDIARCARYAGNIHFGGPMSAVDVTVALYYKYLGFDPEDTEKHDRNMFVLSKGHNGVLLYCIFCDMGMYPWEELMDHYNTIGHTFGAHPNRKYVRGIRSRRYCLLGDGEMEEGSNWEAIMYAGSHHLDNIVAIVDNNHCSASFISGENMKWQWDSMGDCFRAFGWDVYEIDGTNMHEIDQTLSNLPTVTLKEPGKPVCIISNTTKGQGVSYMMERPYAWHIGGLDDEKLKETEELIDQYTAEQQRRG